MSGKKRESAAVESGQKIYIWPVYLVVAMTVLYMGGFAMMRLLDVLNPKLLAFIGDFIHLLGALFLAGSTLTQKDACAGLSLISLHLTALHLVIKVSYGGLVESELRPFDPYSMLGTFVAIYMVGFKYKSSYADKQHNFKMLYLLIPACASLSLVIHPTAPKNSWSGITVAFCSYLNSVSMLPQLLVIRKRVIIDRITAQYLFWLGWARLVYFENWIIEILLTQGQSVTFLGYGFAGYDNIWWAVMGVLSEIVNGFILVDFCYYYMTLHFDVDCEDMHLPSGVV